VVVASRGYRRQVRSSNQVKRIVAISALVCGAAIGAALIGAVISAVGDGNVSQESRGPTSVSDIVSIILGTPLLILLLIVSVAAYLLPTWIAHFRKHRFVGVIFVLNLAGGWSVLGWFVALGWAVWPSETVFTDVLTHDPTGLSQRNVGHAAGEIHNAYDDVRQSRAQP
jgi:integral membrane sensor domain MASE1